MNNIGILTFCDSYNYGAALQAFATYHFLTSIGYNCKFIDYRNQNEAKLYECFKYIRKDSALTNIKRNIKNIILGGTKNGHTGFDAFYSLLPRTKKYVRANILEFDNENKDIDCVLIGSDQVWNPEIVGGEIDGVFWGNFTSKMKISMSSSCGSYIYNDSEWTQLLDLYNSFKSLSVREEFAKKQLLDRGINKKITVLPDPTLLLNKKEWNNWLDKYSTRPVTGEDYLVVYMVKTKYEKCYGYINYLKNKFSCKVTLINIYNINKDGVDYYYRDINPFDFINLISRATCVVTDSFHAVLYSLIYDRDFYYINNGNAKRVVDLLNHYSVLERTVEDFDKLKRLSEDGSHKYDIDVRYDEDFKKARSYIQNAI